MSHRDVDKWCELSQDIAKRIHETPSKLDYANIFILAYHLSVLMFNNRANWLDEMEQTFYPGHSRFWGCSGDDMGYQIHCAAELLLNDEYELLFV